VVEEAVKLLKVHLKYLKFLYMYLKNVIRDT